MLFGSRAGPLHVCNIVAKPDPFTFEQSNAATAVDVDFVVFALTS